MATRVDLTKSTAPGAYTTAGVTVTFSAADATDKNRFVLTGKELIIAWNTDPANPYTVTITSSADDKGRTKDITAESLAANTFKMYGPLAKLGWVQTGGYLHLEANNAAIKFAVITVP